MQADRIAAFMVVLLLWWSGGERRREVVVGWSCEVEVQPRSFELTLDFNFKGIVQLQRYPARGRSAHCK